MIINTGRGRRILSSQYPPEHSDTYVKATSKWSTNHWPYYSTDPAKVLTNGGAGNWWVSAANGQTNQRFNIDLGTSKVITNITYAGASDSQVKDFTLWASNTATIASTTWITDAAMISAEWTQLTCSQSYFDECTSQTENIIRNISITNSTSYRYYSFKLINTWSSPWTYMVVRQIRLQL